MRTHMLTHSLIHKHAHICIFTSTCHVYMLVCAYTFMSVQNTQAHRHAHAFLHVRTHKSTHIHNTNNLTNTPARVFTCTWLTQSLPHGEHCHTSTFTWIRIHFLPSNTLKHTHMLTHSPEHKHTHKFTHKHGHAHVHSHITMSLGCFGTHRLSVLYQKTFRKSASFSLFSLFCPGPFLSSKPVLTLSSWPSLTMRPVLLLPRFTLKETKAKRG
jgi:hypothetical protein